MLLAHPGVVQLVALVIVFDNGAGQNGAFLDPQTLGHRARRHVPHHDFQRDDLHLFHQLLAHVEAAHEMGRDPDGVQLGHQVFADAVVQHTLAVERGLLGGIESGGVVLEILDDGAGLRSFIEDLGLAFVDLAAAFHGLSFRGW